MSSIIEVKDLSKSYTISHEGSEKYTTLRDVMTRQAKKLFSFPKLLTASRTINKEEFWALKDLNFQIEEGDRVGIIGRNGAGKSTLLKILSRITEPTVGKIKIKGRVASLLEVGTGFHPELTGRENIFLNGAILGMSRSEIKKHFDAIVDFSEVEKFLDTPVKRFSSGMYVRLAFAVAAHLESEILIVDEVLAVGDAQFQKKCLGKMEDVSNNNGRTVIFVSHSMPTISSLCTKALLLSNGKIRINGYTSEAIMDYYNSGNASPTHIDYTNVTKKPGDNFVQLLKANILNNGRIISEEIQINEEIRVEIEYIVLCEDDKTILYPNFHFYDAVGTCVFFSSPSTMKKLHQGIYKSTCIIPANLLNQGTYFIGVAISSFGRGVVVHLFEQNALSFNVKDPIYNIPTRLQVEGNVSYSGDIPGTIRPLLNWETYQIK